jgi:hypothetical protein
MAKKETEPTTAMATVEDTSSALMQIGDLTGTMDRPSDIDPNDLSGTEDIGANEIKLPRLCIAQGLSPQMMPGDGKYIEDLKLFQMFNDVTGEIYGAGPLMVVPVLRDVKRIEFDPNDKKVPLDRDVPANDIRTKWTASVPGGKKDVPPAATEFVEFVCMLLRPGKAPEPIVVSIKTTNKHQRFAADRWTTFIGLRGAAIYRGMYQISSKFEKGKTKDGQETTFGVFIVKNAGFIPTEKIVDGKPVKNAAGIALLEMAKQFHESLHGKTITIAREGDDDPDSFDTAAMDAAAASAPRM